MPLNEDQEKVAAHHKGRAWVVAGPGSGKTSSITARIGMLLDRGVAPYNILAITFTNRAANEMRVRMEKSYGDRIKGLTICTFHSLCVRILKQYGAAMGYNRNMVIWDDGDQRDRMLACARQKYAVQAGNRSDDQNEDDEYKGLGQNKIRTLVKVCDDWRENLGGDSALQGYIDDRKIDDIEAGIIRDYLKKMRASGAIDFAGLLYETYRLLKSDEDVRHALQNRFLYLQVDEYQDTNIAQNEIIELIVGPEDNVLAVGDLDQSIYRWRGASPDSVKRFIAAAKNGCTTFELGINYRSTPEIIEWADKLIRHNDGRQPIKFKAAKTSIGRPPVLNMFANPQMEANAIADRIQEWIRDGIKASDIAIFYRMNDLSRPVEQALLAKRIPYRVIGGQSFYDRMEIKDCIAMMRLLVNGKDGASFSRLAGRIMSGLGEKTVGAVELHAEATGTDLVTACLHADQFMPANTLPQRAKIAAMQSIHSTFNFDRSNKTPALCVGEMITRLKYPEWIEAHEADKLKAEERKRNVNQMVVAVDEYMQEHKSGTLEDYLDYISLMTSGDEDEEACVTLMSGHKCKGTEWDCVFAIGIEENLLPNDRAVRERPEFGMAEERCVMYVMATRAKKMLVLSWCKERQKFSYGRGSKVIKSAPSRFLVEAGSMSSAEYGNYRRLAAAGGAKMEY